MKAAINRFWKHVDKMDKKRIASQTAPEDIVTVLDIPYLEDGNSAHTLDIYYHKDTKDLQPVIVDIHGGGWVYGSKELNKYFCMSLASHGFTVLNINYRLTTEKVFPACLNDIFAALEWLNDNGKNYFADIEKVCVAGDSAGAHLALITSIISKNSILQKEIGISPVIDIKALGLICGAFDLEKYAGMRVFRGYQKLIFGDDYMNNSARHIAFPYRYLTKDLPPMYLVSTVNDFAKQNTLSIKPLLEELKLKNKYRFITEKTKHKLTHVFNVIRPEWEESIETNAEMCEFFKENI